MGFNKPYRAPIYRTYQECIQGLYRQGILAFYKGNLLSLVVFWQILLYPKNWEYNWRFNNSKKVNEKPGMIWLYGITLGTLLISHPLHLAEARYVLQNRLPGFQTYTSLFQMFRQSFISGKRDIFNGMPGHLPLAIMIVLINNPVGFHLSPISLFSWGFMLHTLVYPFLTVQRRMEAQVTKKPGMLHGRYGSYLACIYHVHREEGFKGLYRGLPPYLMCAGLMSMIPYFAHGHFDETSSYIKSSKYSENDQLFDEVNAAR